MPLVKDTSYQGVFFEYVLDGIRDILISEFTYGKVYIAHLLMLCGKMLG